MDFSADFQTYQIVYLEHQQTRLYAEVIQVVQARQTCWVRPLILSVSPANQLSPAFWPEQVPKLYDLRQGADLLWPIALFRAALDAEVIPLLAQLQTTHGIDTPSALPARCQLNQFIRQIWQAYPEAF